jgi:hypothetical protein
MRVSRIKLSAGMAKLKRKRWAKYHENATSMISRKKII